MKAIATALSILLVTGCASSGRISSTQVSAPSVVTGVWDLVVTGKHQVQTFSFSLTGVPADTCISGDWFQTQLLSEPHRQISKPAYQYQSGKLEILLSSELCDSYTSFIGNVSGSAFEGSHVSYGLYGSTEHGKVRGVLRH